MQDLIGKKIKIIGDGTYHGTRIVDAQTEEPLPYPVTGFRMRLAPGETTKVDLDLYDVETAIECEVEEIWKAVSVTEEQDVLRLVLVALAGAKVPTPEKGFTNLMEMVAYVQRACRELATLKDNESRRRDLDED